MNGIEYRLRDFIRPQDGRSLLVDASAGLALGALPGLDDFAQGARPALAAADGLVCSPGQLRRLNGRDKHEAALLVRADWTNTLRDPGFVLPPAHTYRLPILGVQDALDLGASGLVLTFLLGYEEEVEAACLRNTVQMAVEGKALGMPLVVEVRASGPRVSLPGKAVELGASYALEGGADVIVVPQPGLKSLESIAAFVSVPWMLRPSTLQNAAAEILEALPLGCAGLWLDHTVFAAPEPGKLLASFGALLHQPVAV